MRGISNIDGSSAETGAWMKATTTGEGPSQRFSLAGDVVDDKKGILFFIGGCNETLEALDDMYYLETGTMSSDHNATNSAAKLWFIEVHCCV